MREVGRADGNAFVLEQRVGALISQLAELEDLRARVREAELMMLHRLTIAVTRSDFKVLRRRGAALTRGAH